MKPQAICLVLLAISGATLGKKAHKHNSSGRQFGFYGGTDLDSPATDEGGPPQQSQESVPVGGKVDVVTVSQSSGDTSPSQAGDDVNEDSDLETSDPDVKKTERGLIFQRHEERVNEHKIIQNSEQPQTPYMPQYGQGFAPVLELATPNMAQIGAQTGFSTQGIDNRAQQNHMSETGMGFTAKTRDGEHSETTIRENHNVQTMHQAVVPDQMSSMGHLGMGQYGIGQLGGMGQFGGMGQLGGMGSFGGMGQLGGFGMGNLGGFGMGQLGGYGSMGMGGLGGFGNIAMMNQMAMMNQGQDIENESSGFSSFSEGGIRHTGGDSSYPVPMPIPFHMPHPQPYPVPVHTPFGVPIPVPHPYPVEKAVEVHVPVNKPYPVPVNHMVPVPVKELVTVNKPYPVHVPVEVEKPVKVEVPVPFPVPMIQRINVPQRVPYPVQVRKNVPIPIPFPVPVQQPDNGFHKMMC